MNKKVISICATVVVVLLAVMLAFIFTTDSDTVDLELEGTWKQVVQVVGAEEYEIIQDTYIKFEEEKLTQYANGETVAEGEFTLDGNILSVPSLGKEYTCIKISDNQIFLAPDKTNLHYGSYIVRKSNDELKEFEADIPEYIKGSWEIKIKNTETVTGEIINFNGKELTDYRNGQTTEPYVVAEYCFAETGNLICPDLQQEMKILPVSENKLYFIEISNGMIWELDRIAE